MNIKQPFGLLDGKLVDITSVESGLACNCVCPCCEKQLVAKKGTINEHHFSHYESEECHGGLETALHIYAKDILKNNDHIVLPPVYFASRLIYPATEVSFDNVSLEKKVNDIVPDIIVHVNGKPLLIEIAVTHWTGKDKVDKILKLGYSGIEIDVKNLFNPLKYKVFGYQDFEKRLIGDQDHKRWINNSKLNLIKRQIRTSAITKKALRIEFPDDYLTFVNDCPLNKRVWKSGYKQGQSYASVYEDCYNCPHGEVEGIFQIDTVRCSGHSQHEIDQIISKFRKS